MSEKKKKNEMSRRKFLKGTIRTAGYILPTITVIKLNTIDAWAQNYDKQEQSDDSTQNQGRSTGGGCTPVK
jgi:hypothetical protein